MTGTELIEFMASELRSEMFHCVTCHGAVRMPLLPRIQSVYNMVSFMLRYNALFALCFYSVKQHVIFSSESPIPLWEI